MTSTSPADYPFPESSIKGSERFTELPKTEQDRLTAKIRVAEDRARANGTAALAVIGVATLLRTVAPATPLPLVLLMVFAVLLTLGLSLAVTFNRDTTSLTVRWMHEEQQRLWSDRRAYLDILRYYQRSYMRTIGELNALMDTKYDLLEFQNVALLLTFVTLVAMLGTALAALP